MTSLQRLNAIAKTLPTEAVDALIALAERIPPASEESRARELTRYLDSFPEEDVDEETSTRLQAVLAESDLHEPVSYEELVRKLNLS